MGSIHVDPVDFDKYRKVVPGRFVISHFPACVQLFPKFGPQAPVIHPHQQVFK